MLLEKVKINPHNRVRIFCSGCNETYHESETYADLHMPFRYLCCGCVGQMMVDGINVKFSHEQNWS